MNKKFLISVGFTLILVLLLTVLAFAQTEVDQLSLRLSRDFGYSSGTGDIQGNFSLRASGPENLVRVGFFMDDQLMGEITEPPFRLRLELTDTRSRDAEPRGHLRSCQTFVVG